MSKLNKLVTNYPVTLSPEEVENLSATLAPVVAACGGGGGGGTPIYYYGDDVNINISPARVIRLTDAASAKLNREIPTKVSDLTDSANYQTVAGMSEYLTTANAQTTYLTKSSAAENLAPISVTGDVNTLKAASANWNEVNAKLGTAQYQADSATFLTAHQSLSDYYKKIETSSKGEIDEIVNALTDSINGVAAIKQNTLNFGYDSNDSISSIDGSALAGQGGTTYTNGAGIEITNDTISISSNYIAAITSVSGKQDELAFTYNTSNAITHINGSAIAGEGGGGTTVYEGKDGVYVDGNNIGLSAGYKTQIEAVSGKITKADADGYYAPKTYTATVNALTGASGKWQESYEVLTAYSAAGTWLTAHQPLTDYYTKSDTSSKTELSTEFAKYQPTGNYATTAQLNTASSTLTGVDNLLSGHIDYVSGQVDNKLNVPVSSDVSIQDKYLVLRTNTNGTVSGWCDFQTQSYSKTEADRTFVATANIDTTTLSGDGKSVSTKLGVKTDVIATRDYVNSSFLPTSGGSVSGDVIIYSSGTNLLTVNTTATLMGQSRVANLANTTAIGTNWLGVNSNGGGFLKNVQGGNVGALNGTSIQIDFAPDGANSYGNITVNSQDNVSKVVHVPTASYNSMSSFDNTNGPNYMLRKTASGFDIGAAVINVTELPQNTEANAYYFVYDA